LPNSILGKGWVSYIGGGTFSEASYGTARALRSKSGVKDFAYTEEAEKTQKVNQMLDPLRINKKAMGVLESCDSTEHPESLPVILTFDVTGSNYSNAVIAQKELPTLMARLLKVIPNPQVAVWSNDDYLTSGPSCIQVSDFESDNRIDDSIRATWLIGRGGSNPGESYDLLLYCAARKTKLDSLDKRGKKGYMFLYADEPVFSKVSAKHVEYVFDDHIQADIPIEEIVKEVQAKYHLMFLWPTSGQTEAREQYVKLVGDNNVITVQSPKHLIEVVASEMEKAEATDKEKASTATASGGEFFREES